MKKQHMAARENCCPGNPRVQRVAAFHAMRRDQRTAGTIGRFLLLLSFAVCITILPCYASVTAVTLHSPDLSANGTNNLTTPIHFQATAESDLTITGYVVYVDGENVFQNAVPLLDAWVVLEPGTSHSLYVKAWDSSGAAFSTQTYQITISGAAAPVPPTTATRMLELDASSSWVVDNNLNVGGTCNDGGIGQFQNPSDPNTANAPDFRATGKHFIVHSKCQYDDSLFYLSVGGTQYSGVTNFLWDFWFYIPTTTKASDVQALEFDLYQAIQLNDGVHEFMFGSQCDYATNQWQNWLPKNGKLTWINVGLSPCQFSTGVWHHATYFLQRVASTGYQEIPSKFGPSTDNNKSLRFGTLTIDGNTMYLGGLSGSTIPSPPWSPTLGVQHQLDSAVSGVTIEQYADDETLTVW
jgi:hypothetical protein